MLTHSLSTTRRGVCFLIVGKQWDKQSAGKTYRRHMQLDGRVVKTVEYSHFSWNKSILRELQIDHFLMLLGQVKEAFIFDTQKVFYTGRDNEYTTLQRCNR